MAQIIIDTGAAANDGTGDPLRTAFTDTNTNFTEIYTAGPVASNVQIANNTILTINTNGNLVLAPNGVGVVQSNVNIVPNSSNIRNLGSSAQRWSSLYVQYASISGNLDLAGTLGVGDLSVTGNLTVTGNTIQIGNLVTDSKTIQLANTASTANAANGSGVTVGVNDDIATLLYSNTANAWTTNIGLSSVGNVTAPYFIGNGSTLTSIAGANVTGTVANATYATSAGSATTAGTVTTAAQGNITSVGVLTSLSASGNITTGNVLTGGLISATSTITSAANITAGNVLTGGLISATGNITGGNISTGKITLTNGAVIKDTAGDSVAFGQNAGATGQGEFAVAIGYLAGNASQGNAAVAIGASAGQTTQGVHAVAIGTDTGATTQGNRAVAIGYLAGSNAQGTAAVAIGYYAGELNQGNNSIIINATDTSLQQTTANTFTVAPVRNDVANIGQVVFYNTTSKEITYGNTISVAGNVTGAYVLGNGSGLTNLPAPTVAQDISSTGAMSIMLYDGNIKYNNYATVEPSSGNITGGNISAVGNVTGGNVNTGVITLTNGAKIKDTAGESVAFGQGAGNTTQGEQSVAIGLQAGFSAQGNYAVAIGKFSANSSQGTYAVAVGPNAGFENQSANAVAIGSTAGSSSQGINSVAIGVGAAYNTQGNNAVAVGNSAAYLLQGINSVAIGVNAGIFYLGDNSIAIGANAGNNLQGNNSIILNATGSNLRNTTANTFTVAPVRNDVANTAEVVFYNATSKEITYGNVISVAGNITGGNILTGGLISSTGNITANNLSLAGNITSAGALSIITGGNGNIALSPNGTGVVTVSSDISVGGNITGNTAGFAIGYRDIPQVAFTANATIATTDAGKHYYSTLSTANVLTIANNASQGFQTGAAISIVNQGTGNITIAQGSGVTLYLAGNATSGNRTVATFGMATIMKVATNTWFINGTGVS